MGISFNYLRVFRTCTIFFLFQEYALQDLFQSQWFNAGSLSSSVYLSIFSLGLEGEGRGLRESASLPLLSSYPRPRAFPQQHNLRELEKLLYYPAELVKSSLMIYPRSDQRRQKQLICAFQLSNCKHSTLFDCSNLPTISFSTCLNSERCIFQRVRDRKEICVDRILRISGRPDSRDNAE